MWNDEGVERPVFWGHLEQLRRVNWPSAGDPLVFPFSAGTEEPFVLELFPEEIAAADHLQSELVKSLPTPVRVLRRYAFDGEDVLLLELGRRLASGAGALSDVYDTIFILLPAAKTGGTPGADMLREVYRRLDVDIHADLAQVLNARRILLVLGGAERIVLESEIEKAFWRSFTHTVGPDVCRLLFVLSADARLVPNSVVVREVDWANGVPTPLSVPALKGEDLSEMREPELPKAPQSAELAMFHKLLEHYSDRRPASDQPERDPTDYRVRLAEWCFSVGAQGPRGAPGRLRPIDIRVRAFLSANRDVFSMDVTIGFVTLSGLSREEWPAEIQIYHQAVSLWLAGLEADEGKVELLQFISTGLFWIHHDTLDALCQMNVRKPGNEPHSKKPYPTLFKTTNLKQRANFMAELVGSGVVHLDGPKSRSGFAARYLMPLGVRAIVQDKWREKKAAARSVAHLAIANRMIRHAEDRKPVEQEMPFAPLIGRGRRFYVLETIRHALQAAQIGDLETVPFERDQKGESPYKFNKEIFSYAWPGSSPEFLLERAYSRLFVEDLAGGTALTLVQRYGLYRVAAEAHYLFERAAFLPKGAGERERFLLMQGYASLEIGALDCAEAQFAAMVGVSDGVSDAATAEQIRFSAFMGSADVALEQGDLQKARDLLAAAEPGPDRSTDEVDALVFTDRRRRLAARQAALCLQESNDHVAAHHILSADLDKRITFATDNTADTKALLRARLVSGNNGHRFIEATIAAAESRSPDEEAIKSLKRARITCGDNALFGGDSGNLHSQLGYRIQYASLQRMLGELEEAEAEMERVRDYVMNYGASVRTFFAMQIEAGKTLLARPEPRPLRALGMYILPCFDLSRRLGYTTWSSRAAAAGLAPARQLLHDIEINAMTNVRATISAGLKATSTGYVAQHQLSKLSDRIPQHLFNPPTVRTADLRLSEASELRGLIALFHETT